MPICMRKIWEILESFVSMDSFLSGVESMFNFSISYQTPPGEPNPWILRFGMGKELSYHGNDVNHVQLDAGPVFRRLFWGGWTYWIWMKPPPFHQLLEAPWFLAGLDYVQWLKKIEKAHRLFADSRIPDWIHTSMAFLVVCFTGRILESGAFSSHGGSPVVTMGFNALMTWMMVPWGTPHFRKPW
jgi:hypothetical protein